MNALTIAAAEPLLVALASIKRGPALNSRASGLDEQIAQDYAEAVQAGTRMPPIVLFKDSEGNHWLGDGAHRCAAYELAGRAEIEADVREGSERDAILHSLKANTAHGLRRTTADKQHAVALLLTDAEWSKRSDRWVAEHAAVSHPFVSRLRSELETVTSSSERAGKDGKVRRLKRMPGKGRKPRTPPTELCRRVPGVLAKLLKRWPKAEPREPFIQAVRAWIVTAESGDGATPQAKHPKKAPTARRAQKAEAAQ